MTTVNDSQEIDENQMLKRKPVEEQQLEEDISSFSDPHPSTGDKFKLNPMRLQYETLLTLQKIGQVLEQIERNTRK